MLSNIVLMLYSHKYSSFRIPATFDALDSVDPYILVLKCFGDHDTRVADKIRL